MKPFAKIVLKPGKEQSILRLHPWIFSGAIMKIEGTPLEGDMVEVFSHGGEFLAMGHYQIGSIAVRLFSFRQVIPGTDFWKQKIMSALFRVAKLAGNVTNVYRLVHGGDECRD
jgi:23S rRNA (cytosine1962-C5)-methyltransferase